MSARVIQDSDDEDDPLSCEAQPPPPPTTIARRGSPAENIAHDGSGDINKDKTQDTNANRVSGAEDIDVNFDDFLQSQSQDYTSHSRHARDSISSSQQRREDRWIPTGSGITRGSSSIELGLAQRRLLDNDAPNLPSTASFPEGSSLQDTRAFDELDNYQGLEYSGEVVPSAHEIQEPSFHDPNQPLRNPYNSMSEHNNGESNGSYNIFDTSHNTLPMESLQQISSRPKSMHITPSPHDTEPLSSLNAGRSKSDNLRYQNESLLQQQLAAEMNSQDELSAPVAAEVPVVPPQKKPAKKNPIQVEDDEDDELAGPRENINSRKSKGNTIPEKENAGHSHSIIRPTKSQEEPENYREPDLSSDKHAEDEIQVIGVNVLGGSDKRQEQEKSHATEHKPPNPKSSKVKDKEPKKKKVKRGKTTSVTVKKTQEPDVEDDVIWVDQRQPSKPNPGLQEYSVHEHSIPTPDSISIAAEEQPKHPTTRTMVEILDIAPKSQGQGQKAQELEQKPTAAQPNKRGRKRKKTSEQAPPQQEPEPEPQTHQEPGDHPDPPNSEEPQHDNQNTASDPTPALEKDKEEPTTKPPETPTKSQNQSQHPSSEADISNKNKGPTKHSPIPGTTNAPYRVGLSRRARIAPLLKIIRR